MKDYTGNPDLFTEIETFLIPEIPYHDPGVTEFAARIIKMADVIEAAHWIRDNGAGAHAQIVANKAWSVVVKLTESYTETTKVDWYAPVNKVLMSLGMPYVYKDAAITPP